MHWYKTAKEIGHGDTLDGQLMKKELTRLTRELNSLKSLAATGGPQNVLPRWRADVRRSIFLLPPIQRLPMMSMYELEELSKKVASIHTVMTKYDAGRMKTILGMP